MAKSPRKPKQKPAKSSPDFTIGLDLGGTKVAVALVDNKGKIVKQTTRPVTPPNMPQLDPATRTSRLRLKFARMSITSLKGCAMPPSK